MNEIIDLITKKISKCNEMCYCNSLSKPEGICTSQKRCENCHSTDILIELLNEVNNIPLTQDKEGE